jgi:alcohol dehydrogenase (cytochrome c)
LGLLAIVAISFVAGDYRVKWREAAIFAKLTGELDELSWPDLFSRLSPGEGRGLERGNPFEAIQNPRRSAGDILIGEQIFRERCSSCHGERARGGLGGPSLYGRIFRNGRSDLALYRTIKFGIPDTAMLGVDLPRDDAWRVVGYLNDILVERKAATATARASIESVAPTELREVSSSSDEWLTYSGSYAAQRYSHLRDITRNNIRDLRVEWVRQLPSTAADQRIEASPIVRGSAMFVTDALNRVYALDAASGQTIWTYSRDALPRLSLAYGAVNRGVALLGKSVFVGTPDAHLVALDAGTGEVLWDVAVADRSSGYSITGAPLAANNMVITGVAGGDYGARGFIDAYDAASGKRQWRFYTAPAAGEPGGETWGGGGGRGAATWLTGSFDPELSLIYWTTGNPSPSFSGDTRPGDNLYSNSIIALDAASGTLRWYFQFTPHDLHNWDASEIPVLINATFGGAKRRLLALANKNGFYYLLDRVTGKFLLAEPFVKQTWAETISPTGRPRVLPDSIPTMQGSIVYPGIEGGTQWWSPTYDPEFNLMYISTATRGSIYFALPNRLTEPTGETWGGYNLPVSGEAFSVAVKALDVTTGRVRWEYTPPPRNARAIMGGLMSTAGQLVFGGDDETFFALDAETGAELWRFQTGGWITAAPVTYKLAGRQYVAIAAGRSIFAFALPENSKNDPVSTLR